MECIISFRGKFSKYVEIKNMLLCVSNLISTRILKVKYYIHWFLLDRYNNTDMFRLSSALLGVYPFHS